MGPSTTLFQNAIEAELGMNDGASSPKKSIFAALWPLLVQILVTAADNCLKGGSTVEVAANSAVNPGPIVKARMRRLMIRDMYDGQPKRYKREGGPEMMEATFKAAASVGPSVMESVFSELNGEPDPDYGWNMG